MATDSRVVISIGWLMLALLCLHARSESVSTESAQGTPDLHECVLVASRQISIEVHSSNLQTNKLVVAPWFICRLWASRAARMVACMKLAGNGLTHENLAAVSAELEVVSTEGEWSSWTQPCVVGKLVRPGR